MTDKRMMLTACQINDLHHLYRCERLPIRKIERRLRMSWRTIKKYLDAPAQGPTQRQDESRLDPCEADTLCSCSPRGGPSRALIQASRRRRPNVINGALTGTASAPTCSGSQTGAQDKNRRKAALFVRPQPALRVQRALPYGATRLQLAMGSWAWRS